MAISRVTQSASGLKDRQHRMVVDVAAGAIEHVGELRRRLVSLDGDGVESIPYLNANSVWLSRSVGEAVPYASRS
jgi:hypothetical protein